MRPWYSAELGALRGCMNYVYVHMCIYIYTDTYVNIVLACT